jgi:uncharacterized protein (TIGR02186 family)
MIRFLTLLTLLIWPLAATPQSLVLGLSEDEVAITVNFDGSQILVFGAVKHEAPVAQDNPLDVIVTVRGPAEPATIYRKDKVLGIWVNNASLKINTAPSFYAISSTGKLSDILSTEADIRYRITLPKVILSVEAPNGKENSQSFTKALTRIRTNNDLYQLNEGQATLTDDTLFRTNVSMPANLIEGDYVVQVFLMQDGQVLADYSTDLLVQKKGLEQWLYSMSREQPFYYGLMALFIAISAGWGASAIFRFIR